MKNVVSRGEKASDCTVFSIVLGKLEPQSKKRCNPGLIPAFDITIWAQKEPQSKKTVHGHQLLELLGVWSAYLRGTKARVPRVIRPGLKEPQKPRPFGENTLSINEKAALSLGDFRNVR